MASSSVPVMEMLRQSKSSDALGASLVFAETPAGPYPSQTILVDTPPSEDELFAVAAATFEARASASASAK
eukprot:4578421-Alexandrium_andersonii.AAC.1